MKKRSLRHNTSGQVIVITALMVALVLLSTAIFVIGTEKNVPTDVTDTNDVFAVYQQAARNTLISALANVTNGGSSSVLSADLDELQSAITYNSYQSLLQMNFTPLNYAPYHNGISILWGTNGQGISSAYVTLEINSTGTSSTSNLECAVNVTSEVDLSGSYLQLSGNLTQVNLTINVRNEGAPALAQNFTIYFESATEGWAKVDSPDINNFGNGTYSITFTTETDQSNTPLLVSTLCQDQRGVMVEANATCTNVS